MTGRDRNGPSYPGLDQLGEFIKAQRKLMALSQRQLAELTNLSDPYVSQLERGLHEPSVRVLRALAQALNVRAEVLLGYAGLLDPDGAPSVVEAVQADPLLSSDQKQALLGVYRGFIETARAQTPRGARGGTGEDDVADD